MDDHLNLSMFRAYDIRTPASHLTPELAERLARAEACYIRDVLGTSGVVVAHDARRTGPQYLTITIEAFRTAGLDVVYLPGACSTSCFYYAAMRHPSYAAVIVGASHNPSGDTGQKILGPGVQPIAEGIGPEGGLDRIKELYQNGASVSATHRGRLQARELIDDYVSDSMALAGVKPGSLDGARIFQDYLYGAAGREMLLAFDRAGATLEPLHYTADGTFPLGDPNPVKQSVIQPGLAAMQRGAVPAWNVLRWRRRPDRYLPGRRDLPVLELRLRGDPARDPRAVSGHEPGRVRRPQVQPSGHHRDGQDRCHG